MTMLDTYYLFTGHTATVADGIAKCLVAKADPILEQSARSGLLGTAAGAVNALVSCRSAITGPLRGSFGFDW